MEVGDLKISNVLLKILFVVYANPGLTGREISNKLMEDGLDTSKREVNQILYSHTMKNIFGREVDAKLRPSWYLTEQLKTVLDNMAKATLNGAHEHLEADEQSETAFPVPAYLHLYPWQQKAFETWADAGYVGVVEAVTGTGKTRLALAAIDKHFRDGWKTAIIVPTIELQNQWTRVIQSDLIEPSGLSLRIGQLGNNRSDSLNDFDVLVTTASSACRNYLHTGNYNGLLIADECHRCGSEKWSRGLEDDFEHRLGLTATYARDDDGKEKYLEPYFKSVCYTLGYDEALADEVIANFKIVFIGFEFNNSERQEYNEYNKKCTNYKNELIHNYEVTPEPFGNFLREVKVLSNGGEKKAALIARYYLNNFNKRRQLLSNCTHKNYGLKKLVPAIKRAERTIVFTQTKDTASITVNNLKNANIKAAMLDSTMHRNERKDVLIGFENGINEVVAAPLLLDEGIDVPAADLAIIVASSRNKRQMIQRMGRVLRKKSDNRLARIVIFYIAGTSEDPEYGAHETYIDLIRDSAEDIKTFNIDDHAAICDYLNDWENI